MTYKSAIALVLALAISGAALLSHPAPATKAADSEAFGFSYLPMVAREPTPTCLDTPHFPAEDRARELAVLDGLNNERASRGLPALLEQDEVTQAARRHSRDMAENDFTSHTGSDGSNAGQRLEEACYEWWTWGEIIAWGYGSSSNVIDAWMNSDLHRDIILSEDFVHFGAGYAFDDKSQWRHY